MLEGVAVKREVGRRVALYLSDRYGNEFPWITGHGSFFDPSPYGITPHSGSDVDITTRAVDRNYRERGKLIDWSDLVDPALVKRTDFGDRSALDIVYLDGVKVDVGVLDYESLSRRARAGKELLKNGSLSSERDGSPVDITRWLMHGAMLLEPIVDLNKFHPTAYETAVRLLERYRRDVAGNSLRTATTGLAGVRHDADKYEEDKKAFERRIKAILVQAREALLASTEFPGNSTTDENLTKAFVFAKDGTHDPQLRILALKGIVQRAYSAAVDKFGIGGFDSLTQGE